MFQLLKLRLKYILGLPIYRVDILRAARVYHEDTLCLCKAISYPLSLLLTGDFWEGAMYSISTITRFFPRYRIEVRRFIGCIPNSEGYWWAPGIWNTGRLEYLDWLIEYYKDDKTNLRTLILDHNSSFAMK